MASDGIQGSGRASESGASVASSLGSGSGLELQPMIHVEQMAASVLFYEALGARVEFGDRDGDFVMLNLGGSRFSLLAHPPNPEQNDGPVELNFQTTQPLEAVEQSLRRAGIDIVQPTSDAGFGRQLQVGTPDGLLIKINQLDLSFPSPEAGTPPN